MDWTNDGEWYCEYCDINFKVYTKDDEPKVNFCPTCAGRKLDYVEPEEAEEEQTITFRDE